MKSDVVETCQSIGQICVAVEDRFRRAFVTRISVQLRVIVEEILEAVQDLRAIGAVLVVLVEDGGEQALAQVGILEAALKAAYELVGFVIVEAVLGEGASRDRGV